MVMDFVGANLVSWRLQSAYLAKFTLPGLLYSNVISRNHDSLADFREKCIFEDQ
jgi:hypothetical protein